MFRITTDNGDYHPTPSELKQLANWGCKMGDPIEFPPHHPNDAKWEAEHGSYLAVHKFEDAIKIAATP